MADSVIYSIVESPTHADFSDIYRRLNLVEIKFKSMRQAISQLKHQPPDIVMAEFFYGYANNYAGVNISNLDVFLFSLQKYAPHAKVVVMAEKREREYVELLKRLFPLYGILQHPVNSADVEGLLLNR